MDRAESAANLGLDSIAREAMREAERYVKHISETHNDEATIDMMIGPTFDRMWKVVCVINPERHTFAAEVARQ